MTPIGTASSDTWRYAKSPADAEVVRVLRNQGRHWFNDTSFITSDDQLRWWTERSQSPDLFRCIIFGEPPHGYGMLIRRDDRLWVSLVVAANAQGAGHGTEIYRRLAWQSMDPVYAAIRIDNHASRRAAEKAGYVRDGAVGAPGISPDDLRWNVLRSQP